MKYFMIFLILIGFSGTLFATDNQIVHVEHYQPDVELLPDNTVQYGESFTIHAWLPIYDDKPEELQYFVDVLDSENNQVDSTLWFAKEDFVYEFDTTHPAYHITKGGTYFIKIEKADQLQRTGSFYKTLEFKINFPQDNLAPLKQFKSGIKFHNVECNDGLVLAQRGNSERSACVTLDTKIELTIRGWADDDRLLLGCIGERVQKCYPEDKDEYRKKLKNYYYGSELESESEDDGILSESDYDPHSPRCGSGVVPYIPKNWQATGKHPSDETWEALGNYLMKQEFYKELQQRNIVFEPACFGVYTGFAEESYPPRFAMCSIVTASNGTNIYLEGTIREFDVTFFDIDNKILYQCDDDHFGCLCVIENEN